MRRDQKTTTKNLIVGIRSILEVAPPKRRYAGFKNFFYHPSLNDFDALKKDWEKVGCSIQSIIIA